tara:strand:+ start:1673 stop:3178 length:1506 start_codon:yes stop_codon:yes gene_type:complete
MLTIKHNNFFERVTYVSTLHADLDNELKMLYSLSTIFLTYSETRLFRETSEKPKSLSLKCSNCQTNLNLTRNIIVCSTCNHTLTKNQKIKINRYFNKLDKFINIKKTLEISSNNINQKFIKKGDKVYKCEWDDYEKIHHTFGIFPVNFYHVHDLVNYHYRDNDTICKFTFMNNYHEYGHILSYNAILLWYDNFKKFINNFRVLNPEYTYSKVIKMIYSIERLPTNNDLVKRLILFIKNTAVNILMNNDLSKCISDQFREIMDPIWLKRNTLLDEKHNRSSRLINKYYNNTISNPREFVLTYCTGGNINTLIPKFILDHIIMGLSSETINEKQACTVFSLSSQGCDGKEIHGGCSGSFNKVVSTFFEKSNIIELIFSKYKNLSEANKVLYTERFYNRLNVIYIETPMIEEGFSYLLNNIVDNLTENNKLRKDQILYFHHGFSGIGQITRNPGLKVNEDSIVPINIVSENMFKRYNGTNGKPMLYFYGVDLSVLSTPNGLVKV